MSRTFCLSDRPTHPRQFSGLRSRLRQTVRIVWSGRDVRARNAKSPSFHGLLRGTCRCSLCLRSRNVPKTFGGFHGKDRGVVV